MTYPTKWLSGEIQRDIREKAFHRCEHCHMKFKRGTNKAISERNSDGKPVIGTVHHLNGITEDCRYDNLVYLCQRCHLHVQSVWRPGGVLPDSWHGVPDWIVRRGLPYVESRQLTLFS